jgi:arginyl-tRNA--protein-N-Asp/Glu arginylyltransferase
MPYLHWNEKTINDFSPETIADLYAAGYVFTRKGKGVMHQTRSVRVDLEKFKLSSENRRILKKVEHVEMEMLDLPLSAASYDWTMSKMAKDFYDTKFAPGIMTANKIKELVTDEGKSNFNSLLVFRAATDSKTIGYCIAYVGGTLDTGVMYHYSYPFYDLTAAPKDMGLGMMTKAIEWAHFAGAKYLYLGSLQRPTDVYKLQFEGLEWFDGKEWSSDVEEVKRVLGGL